MIELDANACRTGLGPSLLLLGQTLPQKERCEWHSLKYSSGKRENFAFPKIFDVTGGLLSSHQMPTMHRKRNLMS
jgi:hypothetical protein